jgi:hypothetical protein
LTTDFAEVYPDAATTSFQRNFTLSYLFALSMKDSDFPPRNTRNTRKWILSAFAFFGTFTSTLRGDKSLSFFRVFRVFRGEKSLFSLSYTRFSKNLMPFSNYHCQPDQEDQGYNQGDHIRVKGGAAGLDDEQQQSRHQQQKDSNSKAEQSDFRIDHGCFASSALRCA